MKKTFLALMAAAAVGTTVSAQTALVQPGYTLDCEYTVAGISNGDNSRSGVGINDKFFVNYHASGIRVYDKDGQLLTTIAPTEGYHNWVNCNVDAAGNLLARLDKVAWAGKDLAGTPSGNPNYGFMVIDTKTHEVLKDYLELGGGFPTRHDALAPVAKNILTDEGVHVFGVLSNNASTYMHVYNAGVYSTVTPFNTSAHLADFVNAGVDGSTKSNAQTTTGYAMEYVNVDGSMGFAAYTNPQYQVTLSVDKAYGNGIAKYKASGTSYVKAEAGEYFYTPMHSGLTGFNFFNLGGKQYIVYPAMNPNGVRSGVEAANNRPADAFAIAEVSTVTSPETDITMEGETLVNGAPAGKLIAVFPGASDAGSAGRTPSYTIQPVEDDENSVYIYVFNSGAPGYKWKFTVPASEVVIPGNNAVYNQVLEDTYTQNVEGKDGVDYNYAIVYSVKYNTERNLTVKANYVWEGGIAPEGVEATATIVVDGKEIAVNPLGTSVTTEDVFALNAEIPVSFKLVIGADVIAKEVTYKVGSARDLTVQPSTEPMLTQPGFTLTELYRTPTLGDQSAVRSGVGIADKFYVTNKDKGVIIYDLNGEEERTIAPTAGYKNWISSNVDAAGHLLAQLDVKAFDGNCSVYPNHGFMVIDTETGEVLKDYLPMGNETPSTLLQEISPRRYDAMAPLAKDIMKDQNVRIITPYNAMRAANQNSYNSTTEDASTYPAYWKFAEFLAHETVANTSTAYALEYFSFADAGKTEMALYHAPNYSTTYSAAGLEGNSIRRCTGNWTLSDDYFYTPMHSGLTGYNIFTLAGKHYIIYPARSTTGADTKDNRPGDAFAIAEISFVDSPMTDMNMEGEVLVLGGLVGTVKALYQGSEGVAAGATSCAPAYTIEPVYGQDNSVFIYVFNSKAPAYKWRFTVGEEQELPEETIAMGDEKSVSVNAAEQTVTVTIPYTATEALVGRKVQVKVNGEYVGHFIAEAEGNQEVVLTGIASEDDINHTVEFACRTASDSAYFDKSSSVSSVDAAVVAPVEYYNLQGIRVAQPENGVFIRKQGNNATKVIF